MVKCNNPHRPESEMYLGYENGFLYCVGAHESYVTIDQEKLLNLYYQHANMEFRFGWDHGFRDALDQINQEKTT